jgi:hypothetical protein
VNVPGKNSRRILVVTLFLAVCACVSALALRPCQLRILAALEEIRDDLIRQAETALDKNIRYTSSGLAFPSLIDIRGITLSGGSGAIPDITAARLRVRYSLRELIALLRRESRSGENGPLFPVKEIVLYQPRVTFAVQGKSAAGDEGAENTPSAIQAEIAKLLGLLPEGMTARVYKGSADITLAGVEGALRNVRADARVKKGRLQLNAAWQMDAELSAAEVKRLNNRKPLSINGSARFRADFSVADGSGRGTIRFSKIRSGLVDIPRIAFTAVLDNNRLSAQKIGGSLPYALSLDVDWENSAADIRFAAERFAVRQAFVLKGAFRQYDRWLPSSISGTAGATVALRPHAGRQPGQESGQQPGRQPGQKPFTFQASLRGTLPRQFPMGASSFEIEGSGDSVRAQFSRLALTLPKGGFSFEGSVVYADIAAYGVFSIDRFALREGQPITGTFVIDTQNRTTTLFAESLFLGDVEFSAFNLEITREEHFAIIGVSALRFRETGIDEESGFGDVRLGRISSEGFLNWKERDLDATLTLEEISAKDLVDVARVFAGIPELPDMLNDVVEQTAFTTDISVITDFKSITYSVPTFVTAYTGKEKNGKAVSITAVSSISGSETNLSLINSTINLPDGALSVTSDFDFADLNDIVFGAEFAYRDLFYYFNGQVLDKSSLTLSGSYNTQAFFSLSGTGSFSGYLRTSDARIPYKDQVFNMNLAASLRYDSANAWSLELDTLELQHILIGTTPITSLRIIGNANQDSAALRTISLTDASGTLSGNGQAEWNADFSAVAFGLNLSNTRGSELFYAQGNYLNGALELRANTVAIKLARFFKSSFNAAVSGIIDFKMEDIFKKDGNWSLSLDVSSLVAEVGSTGVNISTRGEINPLRIRLLDTRVNWGGVVVTMPAFHCENGYLNAAAQVRGLVMGRNVEAELEMAVDFQDFTSLPHFKESFSSIDGVLSLSRMKIDDWTMEKPADFIFKRHDAAFSVYGGPSDMIRMEIKEDGDFYAGFSAPSPVRGVITGNIAAGAIEARGSNLYVDLLSLWTYVPAQDIINIKGGFAIADIEVNGPLNDPAFYGTAQGASVRLEVPLYLNDQVGPLPIAITLDGQEMRFGPVRAPCGSGYATVSGSFVFSRWIPGNFTITIDAPEDHPVPYKVNIAGIKAYGDASGFLRLELLDNVLTVSGNLMGENTEITLDPAGFHKASAQDKSTQVIVDFTMTTGRRVEFLWPNKDLPILQANPVSGNSIHIESDSYSGSFEMKGNLDIRSGEIFYIERSFYIREGTLTFNENETRFSPMIAARAEIRDRTDDGPVTVALIIDNQPLGDFRARFESIPALSQAEIFALLGQSIVGGQESETGQITGAFGGAISDVLSQFSAVRWMERAIRDSLHIDMFSIRTQAISNIFLQAAGAETAQDEKRGIGQYFDNTTVFVGKYLTNDLFVQGMLSVRYDDQNGYDLKQQELKFEPDIGLELRSPLFDIRWNIIPSHPETLFIQDTSFTILWRRSF